MTAVALLATLICVVVLGCRLAVAFAPVDHDVEPPRDEGKTAGRQRRPTRDDWIASLRAAVTTVGGLALGVAGLAAINALCLLGDAFYAAANTIGAH